MAAWMPINGEAIFGTRPWKIFGESSRKLQGGMFNEGILHYTAPTSALRPRAQLYAIALGWPEDRRLAVRSLAAAAGKITAVTLLGHSGDLPWSQTADGLIVMLPVKKPCEHAFALKIFGGNLEPVPLPKSETAIQPGTTARSCCATRSRNHRHYAPIRAGRRERPDRLLGRSQRLCLMELQGHHGRIL